MGDTSLTMSCNEMSFFPPHFMLQTSHEEDHHHPPNSLNPIFPSCTPQNLHQGVESILGKRCEERNGDDDMSDDGSQAAEKKKRLNMEQVKTLEKNFELGNKLEPERKLQLARALGLQPRQIAIWFQNRRARWKSKQLEIDYDLLKKQFEEITADNDALQAQNKKLHAEILALKSREPAESINLNKETEASCSNRSENSSDINLDISRTPAIDSPLCLHPSRPSFPTSIRPTSVINAQIQQNSSKTDVQCQKTNHTIQDESLCNMFCSIVDQPVDDHPGFWPWSEHQQFH